MKRSPDPPKSHRPLVENWSMTLSETENFRSIFFFKGKKQEGKQKSGRGERMRKGQREEEMERSHYEVNLLVDF